MNLETILSGLDKVKRVGTNRYMACCVAHDDKNPSLSLTERDGKILVYCFAGCSQESVIASLRAQGLWFKPTPQERAIRKREEYRKRAEHHRLVLMIAQADRKAGRKHSETGRRQIRESLDFLAGVKRD